MGTADYYGGRLDATAFCRNGRQLAKAVSGLTQAGLAFCVSPEPHGGFWLAVSQEGYEVALQSLYGAGLGEAATPEANVERSTA